MYIYIYLYVYIDILMYLKVVVFDCRASTFRLSPELSAWLSPSIYTPRDPVSLIVEARKLEHHYPRALKVKYKGS